MNFIAGSMLMGSLMTHLVIGWSLFLNIANFWILCNLMSSFLWLNLLTCIFKRLMGLTWLNFFVSLFSLAFLPL